MSIKRNFQTSQMKKYTLIILASIGLSQISQAQNDPYLWLEEIDGEKAYKNQ
jgi:prolyl oligopeptidase